MIRAIIFALIILVLRIALFGELDVDGLYLFFLVGVIASAWVEGFLFGLITTAVSVPLLNFFFLNPYHLLDVASNKDIFLISIFVITSIFVSFLAERMHDAIRKSNSQQIEIKEMRSDLIESTEKVQIVMDSISDAFINIDSQNKIIYLNHAAENLFNESKEKLVNRDFWTLFPHAQESGLYDNISNKFNKGDSGAFEHYSPDLNKWLDVHVFPTLETQGIALYLRDISGSKKREERMRKNEAYYKRFVNSNVIGIIIATMQSEILDVNDAFLNIIGYTREDLKQGLISWKKITPDEFMDIDMRQKEFLETKGVTDTYEKSYLRKDGTSVPTLVARIMIDPEKGICLSYVLDISERKQNEERLKESEQRFRNMSDSAPGMIWMSNAEKLYYYFNKRWLEFRNKTFEEEYGFGWRDGIHPDDQARYIKTYEKAFDEHSEFEMEYRIKRGDGLYRWVLDKGLPRFTPNGRFKGYIGMCIDITERKESQFQLKESKDQLQVIFQNVADAITVQDSEGQTMFINDKAAELIGYSNAEELWKADPKKIQKEIRERFEVLDENGKLLDPMTLPGRRVLKGENAVDMVIVLHDKQEKQQKWYTMKSRAILNEENKLRLAVNVVSDITASKERERQKDEFMSIASHELKTPITTIKAFTQILLKRAEQENNEQNINYLSKMDNQVNNLTKLVSDLLDVSRIQAGKMSVEREKFDLNNLVDSTINNMQLALPSHKIVKTAGESVNIFADTRRIEQVIINLITNAVKYSPDADKIEVKLEADKEFAILSIKDFGIGINKQDQKKIFQRFYVSEQNKNNRFFGLGLGLFISAEIIKRNRGSIEVESDKGKGSTFIVKIPLAGN